LDFFDPRGGFGPLFASVAAVAPSAQNPTAMSEAKYNTNLAAEFHVLSLLHRLGAHEQITSTRDLAG
jgi:hypothetical protein